MMDAIAGGQVETGPRRAAASAPRKRKLLRANAVKPQIARRGRREADRPRTTPCRCPRSGAGGSCTDLSPRHVFPYINEIALFRGQWGFKQGKLSAEEFEKTDRGKGPAGFRAICSAARSKKDSSSRRSSTATSRARPGQRPVVYHIEEFAGCTCHPGGPGKLEPHGTPREWLRFNFPRQEGRRRLCISDFFRSTRERRSTTCSAFSWSPSATRPPSWPRSSAPKTSTRTISTCTASASSRPRRWPSSGTSACGRNWASAAKTPPTSASSSSRATAAAATASATPPARLGRADQDRRAAQARSDRLVLTENFMLVPEQSTDALVAHHPQAKYFDV